MQLLADYFSALGRGIVSVALSLGRGFLRLLAILAFVAALFGVVYSYVRVSVVLGVILTVVFLLGTGFIIYVLNQRYPQEEYEEDYGPRGGPSGLRFLVSLVLLVVGLSLLGLHCQVTVVPQK